MNASRIASLLILGVAIPAVAVEHPGVLHKDDLCTTCHADKTTGKSVHSASVISCTVCHLARTQGDMTTLNLVMPKERICFACHEQSAQLQLHPSGAKGLCVDCHDSHCSDRRMLLRDASDVRPGGSVMLPSRTNAHGSGRNQP